MRTVGTRVISLGAAVALTLAAAPAALGSSHESDAGKYCSSQGGQVVELMPYLYPDSDNQVELGGSLHVCQFIKQDGDNDEQVVVDLTTLYSEKPTLAGLAYLSAVPSSNSGVAGSNPASSYCPDDLGGTEVFGTMAMGGWVGALDPGMEAGDTEPLGDMVNLCVFADRSAIDEFGLFYASDGTYRGVDLSTVMRYQPDTDMPEVFATDS
jgi:putative hemolysin